MKKTFGTLATFALTAGLGIFAIGCGQGEQSQTTTNEFTKAGQVCGVMMNNFAHINTGEVEWTSLDQGNSVGGWNQIVTNIAVESGVCMGTVKWTVNTDPKTDVPLGVAVGQTIPDSKFTTRGRGPIPSVEIRQDFTSQGGRVAVRYVVTGVTTSATSETAWRYAGSIPFDPLKP